MNRSDLFMMALHNLWARKSRTAFNIFGIVVSCSMLLLVFAGSRGARDGLTNMFNNSDFAKKFTISPGRNLNAKPTSDRKKPAEPGKGIGKERMERISEKLNDAWEKRSYPRTLITLEKLEELRENPKIASILPISAKRVQLSIGEQKIAARVICISPETSGIDKRLVFGHRPQSHSSRGKIWIDEYRAWRLGYKTDQQLEDLIGTKVNLRFQKDTAKLSPRMKSFAALFGFRAISEAEQITDAFRKLFADLDQTSLSDLEKESLRAAASRLGLDSLPNDEDVSVNDERFIFREFEIAGIIKPEQRSVRSLFQMAMVNNGNDLLIDWRDYHAIDKATNSKRLHHYNVASVENTDDLKDAVEMVHESGLETRSALDILDKADEELGKVRLIIVAIALVILLIAAVGVMNTMIIAVMERTPEFGIMKAVGTTDSDIRSLMLIEAAFTGVLGAIVSLGVARLIDTAITRFARQFIEERIREEFDFRIFVYTFSDFLIIATIAIVICMLASLLPARRAAKLDPVVAMK